MKTFRLKPHSSAFDAKEIVQMTREELLSQYPREPVRAKFREGDQVVATAIVEVAPHEVGCDHCGKDPGAEIYVLDGRLGYCEACFKEHWEKHCHAS